MDSLNKKIKDFIDQLYSDSLQTNKYLPRNYLAVVLDPYLPDILEASKKLSLPQIYKLLITNNILPKEIVYTKFRSYLYNLKRRKIKECVYIENLKRLTGTDSEQKSQLVKLTKTNNIENDKKSRISKINTKVNNSSSEKKNITVKKVSEHIISEAKDPIEFFFQLNTSNSTNLDEVFYCINYKSYNSQKEYVLDEFNYIKKAINNCTHRNKGAINLWITKITYYLEEEKKYNRDQIKLPQQVNLDEDWKDNIDFFDVPKSELIPLDPFSSKYPFLFKSSIFAYDESTGIIYDTNTMFPIPWFLMPTQSLTSSSNQYINIDCRQYGSFINIEQELRRFFTEHNGKKLDVVKIID